MALCYSTVGFSEPTSVNKSQQANNTVANPKKTVVSRITCSGKWPADCEVSPQHMTLWPPLWLCFVLSVLAVLLPPVPFPFCVSIVSFFHTFVSCLSSFLLFSCSTIVAFLLPSWLPSFTPSLHRSIQAFLLSSFHSFSLSFPASFLPSFLSFLSFLSSLVSSFLPFFLYYFLSSFLLSSPPSVLPSFLLSSPPFLLPSFLLSFRPSFLPSVLPSFLSSCLNVFLIPKNVFLIPKNVFFDAYAVSSAIFSLPWCGDGWQPPDKEQFPNPINLNNWHPLLNTSTKHITRNPKHNSQTFQIATLKKNTTAYQLTYKPPCPETPIVPFFSPQKIPHLTDFVALLGPAIITLEDFNGSESILQGAAGGLGLGGGRWHEPKN